jgi:hypothetical protein
MFMPLALSLSMESVLVFLEARDTAHFGVGGGLQQRPASSLASSASKAPCG